MKPDAGERRRILDRALVCHGRLLVIAMHELTGRTQGAGQPAGALKGTKIRRVTTRTGKMKWEEERSCGKEATSTVAKKPHKVAFTTGTINR
jgi:hypothetical protein